MRGLGIVGLLILSGCSVEVPDELASFLLSHPAYDHRDLFEDCRIDTTYPVAIDKKPATLDVTWNDHPGSLPITVEAKNGLGMLDSYVAVFPTRGFAWRTLEAGDGPALVTGWVSQGMVRCDDFKFGGLFFVRSIERRSDGWHEHGAHGPER